MKSEKYKTMNHDELTLVYMNHIFGLNMSLSDYIIAATGHDERLGKNVAKIMVECNRMGCSAIAQLYLNEVKMGREADLFEPRIFDLNVECSVENIDE